MVAAKLANLSLGANQHSRGSANLPTLLGDQPVAPVTQSRAADMLNVSERSVRAAREVRDHAAPELAQKVERGEAGESASRR